MMPPDTRELRQMDRTALLEHWSHVVGGTPPARLSSPFLRRYLAFELQSRQHGGLSQQFVERISRIKGSEIQSKNAKLKSGGRLIREWNGVTYIVDVTEEGFVWRGQHYRSLSAIARAITGAHWSGPRFFGINKQNSK